MTIEISRRQLLLGGAATVVLAVPGLSLCVPKRRLDEVVTRGVSYETWGDIYRDEWTWDRITFGSHTNGCSPGGCPFYVYSKNGVVWREEQIARNDASDPKYADYNPLGCQKGCSFHDVLYSGHRLEFPIKRVGERGEGKWERIDWDDAITEIADAMIDAIEEHGPESLIMDAPHLAPGQVAFAAGFRISSLLGMCTTDLNQQIGDVLAGHFQTFGKFFTGCTPDNFMEAGLIVLAHTNPSYTFPSIYHYLTEARYLGAEIVVLAPDYNATAVAATTHVPLEVGTDAAFWLGVCHHLESANLCDEAFMKEQTDLALLVDVHTGRFLRGSEVDGGLEQQLYFYDRESSSIAKAPRGTLELTGDPALRGVYDVTAADGTQVLVTPVFELLRQKLAAYTPARAGAICGIDPALITRLAEKMATVRTCTINGMTSAKHYHGDLMERSLCLALAMTGNWGKPGTGIALYAQTDVGAAVLAMLESPAPLGLINLSSFESEVREEVETEDPEISEELVQIAISERAGKVCGIVSATSFLYEHAGYKELWDNRSWHDPAMTRSLSEMIEEAEAKEWMERDPLAASNREPQVLGYVGSNPLRRIRQARTQYPDVLFPKAKMIWSIETRLSSSAMFSDIVLPAAWYYEKWDMTLGQTHNPRIALIEPANPPTGECKPEWDIYVALIEKIVERASKRGLTEFTTRTGVTRRYSELWDRFTMDGEVTTQEDAFIELFKICAALGIFPRSGLVVEHAVAISSLRDVLDQFDGGAVPMDSVGLPFLKEINGMDCTADTSCYPFRSHVHDRKPFPTYARRAQFYIDHEWFLELGEELPVYKAPPKIGGDYPFMITGGHPRHSIHTLHQTNESLASLHRGEPLVHVNPVAARERGVADGDRVRLFNDVNSCELMAKVTPTCAPKQVIVYLWDAMLFKNWENVDNLLVGLPKALHYAGGYEHIGRHSPGEQLPACASDRGVRVDFVKVNDEVAPDDEVPDPEVAVPETEQVSS
jgi:DMSO reductase family type II enzyme molybdopterin subunit